MAFELNVDGLTEISEMLSQMEEAAPAVAAKALYDGAGIMANEVKKGAAMIQTAPFKWASASKHETRKPSPEEKEIVQTGASVEDVALKTVGKVLGDRECSVLTIFYGAEMAEEFVEMLADKIRETYTELEIVTAPTFETICDVVLAFE